MGEPGPGPRRVTRFIAGDVVRKDAYTDTEKVKYRDIEELMLAHFSERFGVRGKIQTHFLHCEASKAIQDMFCNSGIPYVAHGGYSSDAAPALADCFDADVHSATLMVKKCRQAAEALYSRYPEVRALSLRRPQSV